MYEHRTTPLLPRRAFFRRLANHGALAAAILAVSLAAGMIGYRALAGMAWIDAFLNAAMILGGMGPVDRLDGGAAKIFAGIYALYAGFVLLASFSILLAPVFHRILHRLHLQDR